MPKPIAAAPVTSVTTPAVTPGELFAAYDEKIKALICSDRTLVAEQIELEAGKELPEPAPPDDDAPEQRARELVNGFAPPARVQSKHGRLYQVLSERKAIVIALSMLADAERRTGAIAVAEVIEARGEDWLAITRRRALALLELLDANREAASFRLDVARLTGQNNPGLICDRDGGLFGVEFMPIADRRLDARGFLEQCARENIITAREFAGE